MARSQSKVTFLIFSIFLVILTGCFGGSETGSVISHETAVVLPPAVSGNALVALNDEAPVIRNESGEPIRKDSASLGEVIHFEGFNEE